MRTLIPEPLPAEVEALLERRRRAGLDRLDEVWEGIYHVVSAPSDKHALVEWQLAAILRPLATDADLHASGPFNLGRGEDDFRVPDGGLHRGTGWGTWAPTAALVVEIISPGDETWEKLPFYARHQVDELLVVDPEERAVHWRALAEGEYRKVERSGLIELGAAELAELIDWP